MWRLRRRIDFTSLARVAEYSAFFFFFFFFFFLEMRRPGKLQIIMWKGTKQQKRKNFIPFHTFQTFYINIYTLCVCVGKVFFSPLILQVLFFFLFLLFILYFLRMTMSSFYHRTCNILINTPRPKAAFTPAGNTRYLERMLCWWRNRNHGNTLPCIG